ncbi:GNAT family N-acetyltransferase [Modestobacter marinus]|uniref:N-acetyltransferase n=1 Tax=Modestobacter marinus TaxID=477641 RepID=A0A846M095_9ACTN|nr:GNAT family N-acetyltransferase [Modestobacter marinus]NIH69099.1 RimJ/RimL family protein N-acetyltransferase [Modestobacter marinus]GGL77578.1 N-acetyltransferase [Modestobacter marinus]
MELLCTDRLRLRAWTTDEADLARLADLYSREEVTRWLGGAPTVPPAELVERWRLVHELDPAHGCWAVEPRSGGPPAGTVLLKPLPQGVGEVEVGWHLHPDSWRRGYATEAARAVVDRAFDDGLLEVYAVVRPGNQASLRVCQKLGMQPLGRTTRWYGTELEAFRLEAPPD